MEDPYKRREYFISPHNPQWQDRYADLAAVVGRIFKQARTIEHVGSTSIPGMSGKDCVDVMVVIEEPLIEKDKISAMEVAGLLYAGSLHGEGTHMFRQMDGPRVLANIHIFQDGNVHISEMVRLRDYMRKNPEAVRAYSELKRGLFKDFPTDYRSYRKYKDEYVRSLMETINETYENRTV